MATFPATIARFALTACAIALSASTVAAHDLWIEPTAFVADLGKVVGVKLRVGDHFHGDPVPRNEELIEQFVIADATGRRDVVGRDGADPAGLFRVTASGLLIVGYHSKPNPVVVPAEKFAQYLKEEGLDAIAALRARSNQANSEARELFTRCVKSLVASGPGAAGQSDRALGFTLELVAEKNPYQLAVGGELPIRLLYENKPLANALVVAMNQRDPWKRQTARSDADGRVRFTLPLDGTWMVKAVHMVPATAGKNADWESYWSSLTFEIGAH